MSASGEGFSILSRRRFLGLALSTGSVVLMGGVGSLFALRGCAPDVAGLGALTPHEYRTLSKLAEALLPEGGAFPPGARGSDLATAFDRFLADEPPWNRSDLKKALFLLEFGPVLYERRAVTFSHLGVAERLAHFERWSTSERLLRRQVALAFRKFLSLVFYDRPEVWPYIGYDGPLGGL